MNPYQKPTKNSLAQQITWCAYVLMLLMMIITSLPGQIPEGSSSMLILLIKLLPLLIVLPGLIKDTLRAYIWLCFIILFYFTQAVVESFLSLAASTDLFITLLTIIIFNSAMLYIKWERQLGREIG
jgi:uncharacterized membrane protein